MRRSKQSPADRPGRAKILDHGRSAPPYASLLLLTLVAGWVDAMCFLSLGKVFSSFMSGNVLFLGIAAGQGDWAFFLRASIALASYLLGAASASIIVERGHQAEGALCGTALAAETVVLSGFAIGWLVVDASSAYQIALLATAALAMGMQAATVLTLNIPGVATNALTGTVTLMARLAARRAIRSLGPSPVIGIGYLLLLCSAYALSAGIVVIAGHHGTIAVVPPGLLLITTIAAYRGRIARQRFKG